MVVSPFRAQRYTISGLWVLANVSFAACELKTTAACWRTLSFIFGLPGTIVTFLLYVREASMRNGVDLPERERPESSQIANWVELTLQES
jgi:hypothetical protein